MIIIRKIIARCSRRGRPIFSSQKEHHVMLLSSPFSTPSTQSQSGILAGEVQGLKVQLNVLKHQLQSLKRNSKRRETFPYVVLFEGNMACGKSTCLEYIRRNYPQVESSIEPIDKWTDIGGHNALSLLYQNPNRWCFHFESYALLTRLQQHVQKSKFPVKFLERSLFSTMHVFIENDIKNGMLHPMEYAMLKKWYDWIVSDVQVPVDLIVYLQSSPEVCFERTKARGRKEEENVRLSYVRELHDRYEDWLVKGKYPVCAPVTVIDADKPLEQVFLKVDDANQQLFGMVEKDS